MKKLKFVIGFMMILFISGMIFPQYSSAEFSTTPIVQVENSHYVVLKSDGTVWIWGTNETTPVQVNGLSEITSIAAGNSYYLALKSDGTVWAWGAGDQGQLGNGTRTGSSIPVKVNNISSITAISTGFYSSYALKSDGTVWAWGNNTYGQLGDGTTEIKGPSKAKNLYNITAIASDRDSAHVLALKSDGTVWAWGNAAYGALGNGLIGGKLTIPENVSSLTSVTNIDVGPYVSYAKKSDGTVWGWGSNKNGQILVSGISDANVLSPIEMPRLTGFTSADAGCGRSIGLKSINEVYAWGSLIDNHCVHFPAKIKDLDGIASVASSSLFNIALKSDGTVYTWQRASYGGLDSNYNAIYIITQVDGLNLASTATSVTGVTLDVTDMNLFVGDSKALTATIQPSSATNKTVTWTSQAPNIATVDNLGMVTGFSKGNATIRAATQEGSYTATCNVTVVDAESPQVSTDGDYIVLKDPEFLVPVTYDCAAGFTVTENGVDVPVTRVRVYDGIDGWSYSEIELTLQRPVTVGSDVVINYVFDPDHPITVRSGSSGSGSSGGTHYYTLPSTLTTVVNHSTQPVTISHSTVTIAGDGRSMHIELPVPVNTYDYTGSAGFFISSDGTPINITRVVTSGRGVYAYFGETIPAGASVSVGYEPIPEYPITTVVGGSQIVLGYSAGSSGGSSGGNTITVPNTSNAPIVFGEPTVKSDGQTVYIPSPATLPSNDYEGNAGFHVFSNDGREIPIFKVEIKGNQIILYLGEPLIGNGIFIYEPDQNVPSIGPDTTYPPAWSNQALEYIEVIPAEYIISVGETKPLLVNAHFQDGIIADVTDYSTYASDHPEIVIGDSKGIVNAVSPGIANITATFLGKSATCKVTVKSGQVIPITGISLDVNDLLLTVGDTKNLIATITPSDATNHHLTWVSSDLSIATVDGNGKVTGLKPGVITVTVTTEEGNYIATCTVTVRQAAPKIQSLLVFPTPINLLVGDNQQITVKVRYSDGSMIEVTADATYTSNKPEIAAMDASNINQVNGIAVGTTTVTVSYEGKSATIPVTVSNPIAKSLTIDPSPVNITAGMTKAVKVIARLSNGSTIDVTEAATLAIADGTKAIVDNQTITGVQQGTTTLTATYQGISTTAMVIIHAPIVQSLTISPSTINIAIGRTSEILVVKAVKSDRTEEIIPNSKVQFSFGNAGIASVTSNYRILGNAIGGSVLTASYSGLNAQVNVTVGQAAIERLIVNPNPISVTVGKSVAITVTAVYSDGRQQIVPAALVPHESNAGFTISNSQLTGTVVGNYDLDVTYDGQSLRVPVTVTAPTVESISVSDITVGVGQTKTIQATAHMSDGTTLDISAAAAYALMNSNIASLAGSHITGSTTMGKTTATTVLLIKYQGMSANANVTITAPVATGLTVAPNPIVCNVGDTVDLNVVATMSYGSSKNVTTTATYGISNQICDVNGSGVLLALKAGTAEVVITYNGNSVSVPVTVNYQPEPIKVVQGNYKILITSAISGDVNVKFTLTSNDPSTVYIPSSTSNRVYGKKLGICTITVTYYNSKSGISASYQLPVQVVSVPVNKPK